ncbi:uncharacterized protein LOC127244130 [Andrographis paniculata]|uniref:uncharacterized protein LOC127244130 n=1 Tax=Andrographis paniculata TaxID=175694 RepID=UPI0021E80F73|nr:uncharacterized protein LOC127244130 [Andrographis paniculata]
MDSPPNSEGKDSERRTDDLEPSAAGKFHNSPAALDIRHVKDAQSSTGSSYPKPTKKRQRKMSRRGESTKCRADNARWTKEFEVLLVSIFYSHFQAGHLVGKDFTKATWGQIAQEFAQETRKPYQLYQLQGKYVCLREAYCLLTELRNKQTRLGWDAERGVVTGDLMLMEE